MIGVLIFSLFSLFVSAQEDCDFRELPKKLSQTCLYTKDGSINPELLFFKPKFTLWTDGADKLRWIYLPPGTKIDSSDMNHWKFPVGTRVFKQFGLHGKKLETRLFVKTAVGNGIDSWQMGPYIWSQEQTDATLTLEGASDVLGTHHDVPNQRMCKACHRGAADSNLGFSALQQSAIIDFLVQKNLLTHAPSKPIEMVGTEVQKRALGYLHANCSHCHNPDGVASFMNLYYDLDTPSVEKSNTYLTAVNKPSMGSRMLRVAPGKPQESFLYRRLSSRSPELQMPPVGTKVLDPEGQEAVFKWIESL